MVVNIEEGRVSDTITLRCQVIEAGGMKIKVGKNAVGTALDIVRQDGARLHMFFNEAGELLNISLHSLDVGSTVG